LCVARKKEKSVARHKGEKASLKKKGIISNRRLRVVVVVLIHDE
jgi:hypothetical protein